MDEADDPYGVRAASQAVADARRQVAMATARLAEASVRYRDRRVDAERSDRGRGADRGRSRPGEFAADELSLVLREQPFHVSRLVARSRRVAAGLPTVWEAYRQGDLDAEQVRVVDRVARRAELEATRAAIDGQAVDAAQTRCPRQLAAWLLRLVVRLEPDAFARRHRRALAERRVTAARTADGMGYVTGEVSAADAAAIDTLLASGARGLGKGDPRSHDQRRADLFADLLLGRLRLDDSDDTDEQGSGSAVAAVGDEAGDGGWLEVEDVDPDTGELLGTRRQRVGADGEPVDDPVGEPADGSAAPARPLNPGLVRRPRPLRIGVVVPLSSLLGCDQAPGELADRTGLIPGQVLRQLIADALDPDGDDEVLFARLLTDDGGRLLDTTELGRHPSRRLAEAVQLRAGTCSYPTCTVPADRCDQDHHDPWPDGRTRGDNLDPLCRRHHRGKTHAWHASRREDDTITWTLPDARRYVTRDEPLPVGAVAA